MFRSKTEKGMTLAFALLLGAAALPGCSGTDPDPEEVLDEEVESEWSASWSGGASGEGSGDSVVITEQVGLMRHNIALGYDGAPVRILLTVDDMSRGTNEDVESVLELADEGLNCLGTAGTVELDRYEEGATVGSFEATVNCSGDEDAGEWRWRGPSRCPTGRTRERRVPRPSRRRARAPFFGGARARGALAPARGRGSMPRAHPLAALEVASMPTWSIVLSGVLGALALAWVLVELKTSRPDGRLARVHSYRRMMPIIMPSKVESVVYFDAHVDVARLRGWLDGAREATGCDITHVLVAAVARGLHQHPNMNRFVAGKRLYERDGVWVSFSMKRKARDARARLATVKLEVPAEMTFAAFCEAVNAQIGHERSGEKTYLDRELALFFRLPHPVLWRAQRLLGWLDDHHLLPGSFIREDAMYTSAFVANLGSLGMDPGYHHLYEWGNCPLFIMAGQIERVPVVGEDGQVEVREVMPVRFTYDERVEDGLSARHGLEAMAEVLEDPARHLGERGERALG